MAIFGGDDSGGGVTWAPQVIEDAKDHGLVRSEHGKLFDTKKGQSLPERVKPMQLLSDQDLQEFPEPTAADVVPKCVARYRDVMASAFNGPAKVIGDNSMLRDRSGFEVDFLTLGQFRRSTMAPTAPKLS